MHQNLSTQFLLTVFFFFISIQDFKVHQQIMGQVFIQTSMDQSLDHALVGQALSVDVK